MNSFVRSTLFSLALGVGLVGNFAKAAEPTIALQSGQPVVFNLSASGYIHDFYIDVQPGDRQLRINISGTPANDIDLFVRFGSPFPDALSDFEATLSHVDEYAQYRAISANPNETLVVNEHAGQPIRPGRWHIAVLSFGNTATSVTLTATRLQTGLSPAQFTMVFDDTSDGCQVTGWSDPASRAAVGGNSGTTLGAQRRNAANEAARLLAQNFTAAAPIRIQACWASLESNSTLAQAGPSTMALLTNKQNPRSNTYYAAPAAVRLNGGESCSLFGGDCASSAITATFNLKVDGPEILGSNGYWYGLNPKPTTSNDADFISVAMHEIVHGLGFLSVVNTNASSSTRPLGAKLNGFDDIFGANLAIWNDAVTNATPYLSLTNEERATVMASTNRLRWSGEEAVNSALNTLRSQTFPINLPEMYTANPIEPGSVQSHIGQFHRPTLMYATGGSTIRELGLAAPMLNAVGWSQAATTPPTAPQVLNGLYFDPRKPGHGVEFQKVAGTNIYVMIFYTYDAAGEPEWYLASGEFVDGRFIPRPNDFGDDLSKYRYSASVPHQIAVPSASSNPDQRNFLVVDYHQPGNNDTCKGVNAQSIAQMTFSIDNDRSQRWCLQPLLPSSLRPSANDFTGTWYAGEDSGWGFAIGSFTPSNLFAALFYPDAQGNGRWAYALADSSNTTSVRLMQRRGYCRTCAVPANALAGQFEDREAGTISFDMRQRSASASAGNKTSFTVNYLGAQGGTFSRNNSPLLVLAGDLN